MSDLYKLMRTGDPVLGSPGMLVSGESPGMLVSGESPGMLVSGESWWKRLCALVKVFGRQLIDMVCIPPFWRH